MQDISRPRLYKLSIRDIDISICPGVPGDGGGSRYRAGDRAAAGPGGGHRLHHGQDRGQPAGHRQGHQGGCWAQQKSYSRLNVTDN